MARRVRLSACPETGEHHERPCYTGRPSNSKNTREGYALVSPYTPWTVLRGTPESARVLVRRLQVPASPFLTRFLGCLFNLQASIGGVLARPLNPRCGLEQAVPRPDSSDSDAWSSSGRESHKSTRARRGQSRMHSAHRGTIIRAWGATLVSPPIADYDYGTGTSPKRDRNSWAHSVSSR